MPPWGIAPFPRVVNANREIPTSPVKISLKTWVMISFPSFPPPNPSKSQLLLEQKAIGFRWFQVTCRPGGRGPGWSLERVGKHGRIVYKWGLVLPLPGYIIYWLVTSCYFQFMAMSIGNIGHYRTNMRLLQYLKVFFCMGFCGYLIFGHSFEPYPCHWGLQLDQLRGGVVGRALHPMIRWIIVNQYHQCTKDPNTIKQYQAPVCQKTQKTMNQTISNTCLLMIGYWKWVYSIV